MSCVGHRSCVALCPIVTQTPCREGTRSATSTQTNYSPAQPRAQHTYHTGLFGQGLGLLSPLLLELLVVVAAVAKVTDRVDVKRVFALADGRRARFLSLLLDETVDLLAVARNAGLERRFLRLQVERSKGCTSHAGGESVLVLRLGCVCVWGGGGGV